MVAGLDVFTTRLAGLADLTAIVQLERYCFTPEIAFGKARWRYLLARSHGKTYLLHDEQARLVGYLCLLEHRGWNRLVVQSLAIRWTVRRQGLARQLLSRVIEQGLQAGWTGVSLEVAQQNHGACLLYQQLGFVRQKLLADYYGQGIDGYRLFLPFPKQMNIKRNELGGENEL